MRLASAPPFALALALALAACVSQAPSVPEPAAGGAATAPDQAAGEPSSELEREGVFAPVEFDALALWPEAYSGELLVLEALPHGTIVEEGEVLARIDLGALEDQVRDAELELRSATVRHEAELQKNVLADEAAADALQQATARLDRARRALEGYLEKELEFARRASAWQTRLEQGRVDDQVDELDQLEKMYAADELIDATEDIVLKRSRRDLERTRERTGLSMEQRAFEAELTRPLQVEARREEVALQERALARLEKTQAVEARARADSVERSAAELEKKRERLDELTRDRAMLELRAPRAGVLLHGALDDYRPGGKPPRWKRGSRLSTRTDLMLVADPAHVAVVLDVPEKDLGRIEDGARAQVAPLSDPGAAQSARVDVDSYPAARGGGVFEARIELGKAPEVVFGMGAKVAIECAPEVEG